MCYKQKCKVVSLNLAHPVYDDHKKQLHICWSWDWVAIYLSI